MYHMKKTVLLVSFLIMTLEIYSQSTWIKTQNIDDYLSGVNMDTLTVGPQEMCVTSNGTIISIFQPSPEHEIWLLAIDSLGNILWKKIIGTNGGIFHEHMYKGNRP